MEERLTCVECGDPLPRRASTSGRARPTHHPSRCDPCLHVITLDVIKLAAPITMTFLVSWGLEALNGSLEAARGFGEDL